MRLAIDFDGTIADTNRTKSVWIKEHLGLDVAPWQCDRTNCVAIIGAEAYAEMGESVYDRDNTLRTAEVPGAFDALRHLSQTAKLFVVTARPPNHVLFAREWFDTQGIGCLIHDFHSSKGTSKEAICRAITASALVDDDLRHLEDVRLAGLRRIHFQNGASISSRQFDEVIVCRSWPEVVSALEQVGDENGP